MDNDIEGPAEERRAQYYVPSSQGGPRQIPSIRPGSSQRNLSALLKDAGIYCDADDAQDVEYELRRGGDQVRNPAVTSRNENQSREGGEPHGE